MATPPKNPQKAINVCIGILALCGLVSFMNINAEKQSVAPISSAYSNEIKLDAGAVEAAIEEIKSDPQVKDMHYDSNVAIAWEIGVLDDGSKRYGLASYICEILHSHNLVDQNTFVRITDIQKLNRGETFRSASLGKVSCSSYEQSYP